jgi:hypothetical protein
MAIYVKKYIVFKHCWNSHDFQLTQKPSAQIKHVIWELTVVFI